MQTTKVSELRDSFGLEAFLRNTRRRFWFLESMTAISTVASLLVLWSILLVLWPHRPVDSLRWFGLILPAGLLGYAAWELFHVHQQSWMLWHSRRNTIFWLSSLGLLTLGFLLLPIPTAHTFYVYWWIGIGSLLIYLFWMLFHLWRKTHATNMARQIEQWKPEIRGYLTALELSRSLPHLAQNPMYSSDLAEARIEQIQRAMHNISPTQVVPDKIFEGRAGLLFVASGIFFFSILVAPQWTTQMLGLLILPPPPLTKNLSKTDQPIVVADLVITYRFPAYAKIPPRTIHNSDGSLYALKGTEVQLRAQTLEPVTRAVLLINQQQTLVLRVDKDQKTLHGSLTLTQPGTYQFRVVTVRGALRPGQVRTIRIQPDENPTVELLYPDKDLEVKERQLIPLRFKFADDFGVTTAHLVYRNLTSKRFRQSHKILLKEFEEQPQKGQHDAQWDLQKLPFGPGDRIEYYLEIRDNDTIHGLKMGRSASRYLKIFSPLEEHDRLLKEQEKLLDHMVHFLGDLLTAPKAETESPSTVLQALKKLNGRGQDVLSFFVHLLPKMRKDALTKSYAMIAMERLFYQFRSRQYIRRSLTQQAERAYAAKLSGRSPSQSSENNPDNADSPLSMQPEEDFPRERIQQRMNREVPDQENDVYALTMLLNRQRLDVLKELATQLTQTQNRVQDLLEQYRRKRDKDSKEALLQELQRLERLIREINRRMAALQRHIPDEFVNMKAFQDKSSLGKLQKLKDMIQKDNLEDAAKELSRLAKNIEEMVSQMDRYAKEAGGQSMNRMMAAMRKMMEQLQQLEHKQERLSKRTQEVQQKVAERMRKDLQKQLNKLLKKQIERTQKMKQALESIRKNLGTALNRYRLNPDLEKLEHRNSSLERMLKAGDIFESLEIIQQYQQESRWMGYSIYRLQRLLRIYRDNREQTVGKSQIALQKSADLSEKIRQDLEKATPSPQPYMTPQDRNKLNHYNQQQDTLRQEVQRLQQKMAEMSRTMPMFQPGMQRKLQGAGQEMGKAARQLRKNAPQPAFDHQQQAVAKLREVRKKLGESMKQQGQQGQQGQGGQGSQGGQGGQGNRDREVKIPDASAHKAPKALRQDILDAMKEKFPNKYKERVHRYYEKLAK